MLIQKIRHRIAENILRLVAWDVLVQVLTLALAVAHLAEYASAIGHDTLNGITGAVGVVVLVHAGMSLKITVLESNLAVSKQVLRHLFRHHKLALAMADGHTVNLSFLEGAEPG